MGILGGIGPTELIIILVICLLIFGPKNLPKLGNSLGKTVKGIRKGMEDDDETQEPKESSEPRKITAADDKTEVDVVINTKTENK